MRASAVAQSFSALPRSPDSTAIRASASTREHLDMGFTVATSVVENRCEPLFGAVDTVTRIERGQQALAEGGLLASADRAVPCRCRLQGGPGPCVLTERTPGPGPDRTHARAARRTSPVASPFSTASSRVATPVS